ncbi:MAG: hypothetical protein ABSC64_05690 [Candidatus Korobacteraceae bacterium]|jgi:hypothetical protein
MKKLIFLLLLVPVLGWAQSPFEGTWKLDLSKTELPRKPDVLLVQNGMFECQTCTPPINVKADGQFQKVSGSPYINMIKVTVVDDRYVNSEARKDGKQINSIKRSVSEDGNTLTEEWTYYGNPTGGPVSGTDTMTRRGMAPARGNAVSGAWREAKSDVATADALLFTYTGGGDSLSMTTPTGQSYTAKLDGKDVPYVGDPGTTSVSLKRIADSIEETDKRDGKVISVSKMTVAPDGATMTIVVDDKLHGSSATYVAEKQ